MIHSPEKNISHKLLIIRTSHEWRTYIRKLTYQQIKKTQSLRTNGCLSTFSEVLQISSDYQKNNHLMSSLNSISDEDGKVKVKKTKGKKGGGASK